MMDVAEAEAVTQVFWDINSCPVPDGYDACLVGPCIKQFLKNSGYSGPVTITVVGLLSDVPKDILRAISFTGINLHTGPFDASKDMVNVLFGWKFRNKPPANLMVITRHPNSTSYLLNKLRLEGYNTILPYPYDHCLREATSTDAWINFLLENSGAFEEDNFGETGESAKWSCSVCYKIGAGRLFGRGIENFINHLASPDHAQKFPCWFPPSKQPLKAEA